MRTSLLVWLQKETHMKIKSPKDYSNSDTIYSDYQQKNYAHRKQGVCLDIKECWAKSLTYQDKHDALKSLLRLTYKLTL